MLELCFLMLWMFMVMFTHAMDVCENVYPCCGFFTSIFMLSNFSNYPLTNLLSNIPNNLKVIVQPGISGAKSDRSIRKLFVVGIVEEHMHLSSFLTLTPSLGQPLSLFLSHL
uniref:Secreted protein n=1 Tax=Clastoptera arizonana TaxID=38151 RepID=A0A1B6CDS7_9HEMI